MTNFGQLVYMQKPKQLSKLITNGSNKEKTKRIEQFPKNPGIEYKANTVPKNTGIPGFCKNTVPYRTGMKFLIPLGPAYQPTGFASSNADPNIGQSENIDENI